MGCSSCCSSCCNCCLRCCASFCSCFLGCCRVLVGLTLVLRTAFHLVVAAFAAQDLYNLNNDLSGTLRKLALTLHGDNVSQIQAALVFFIICGVCLFILSCAYPWKGTWSCSHKAVFGTLHVLYAGMVAFVMSSSILAVSTYPDQRVPLREIYVVLWSPESPWFPFSFVLDVVTFISAVLPSGKCDCVKAQPGGVLPLHPMTTLPRPAFGTLSLSAASPLPPYTQLHEAEPVLWEQDLA